MTCESDVSIEQPLRAVQQTPETIVTREKVIIQRYDDLDPQILSSTPSKCLFKQFGYDDELLSICREAKIQIIETNQPSPVNLNTTEIIEVVEPSTSNLTQNESRNENGDVSQVYYNDDEEPVSKKLKVKVNISNFRIKFYFYEVNIFLNKFR